MIQISLMKLLFELEYKKILEIKKERKKDEFFKLVTNTIIILKESKHVISC